MFSPMQCGDCGANETKSLLTKVKVSAIQQLHTTDDVDQAYTASLLSDTMRRRFRCGSIVRRLGIVPHGHSRITRNRAHQPVCLLTCDCTCACRQESYTYVSGGFRWKCVLGITDQKFQQMICQHLCYFQNECVSMRVS